MNDDQRTNPPTCTCQYLTVGNRLTTHNAVDSSRCEVHGPLSALRPPTPSASAHDEHRTRARAWLQAHVGHSWMWKDVDELAAMLDEAFDLGVERGRMGQPSTDPRLADLARWIVQEADNQIDSRGQARRDHACAECIPGGEIVIPGFRCALHIAREIDRCTEHPRPRCANGCIPDDVKDAHCVNCGAWMPETAKQPTSDATAASAMHDAEVFGTAIQAAAAACEAEAERWGSSCCEAYEACADCAGRIRALATPHPLPQEKKR